VVVGIGQAPAPPARGPSGSRAGRRGAGHWLEKIRELRGVGCAARHWDAIGRAGLGFLINLSIAVGGLAFILFSGRIADGAEAGPR
jgi:hypothetical protein